RRRYTARVFPADRDRTPAVAAGHRYGLPPIRGRAVTNLAVFVPAATMRLLAEENRDGTLELLLTHPIKGWIVLMSKFLSGFIFVGFMIITTIGIPIAVSTAGDLDIGAVIGQYVASLFLAASLVSIGLFTSSLTRNQIVAFILGLALTMILMVMGQDNVAVTLPNRLATLLQDLSPVTHFSSVARGVIHVRDVVYFIALISTFLSATFLMIRGRTLSHKSTQYRNLQLGVAGLIIFSLLVGWSGTSIGGRLDLTEDKLFTMSQATSEILEQLDDILTVEVFESEDPPTQIKLVTRDVNDFLEDFVASSDGRVRLVRRFPGSDENEARKASLAGIPAVQFNRQTQSEFQITSGYLGLAMTYIDQREVIPFISSIDGFEYRLASLANKMLQEQKKTVGFLTGHGEKTASSGYQTFAGLLSDAYNVIEIPVEDDGALDLSNVDVLIIGGPDRRIPDPAVAELRRFVDSGGKAMIMIDSVLVDQARLIAQPNLNSFASFVGEYGVVVENDLVFDVQSNETLSFGTQVGSVFLPYPFWPRVPVVDVKVAGNVSAALMPWGSSLGILESARSRIEVIPLLETTEFATIDRNYGDLRPNSPILTDVVAFNPVQSLMGVAISERGNTSSDDSSFRLVVFGTSRWIMDGITDRADQNLALGLNLIDWLAQEDTLAAVRSKAVTTRDLLFSSGTHENISRWANVAGVPLALVAIGALRSLRRRRFGSASYGQAGENRSRFGMRRRGKSSQDDGGDSK
ncbi:MAG: Gldg family protein, partial [Chloroflexi bacterium]|nr:Gldg family protein [Chloroflexota bacterium]